jgi:hypothetical protein
MRLMLRVMGSTGGEGGGLQRHDAAGELKPNPKNWRTHPPAQQEALKGILAEVGYADALIAREMPDGSLMLLDGHLRAETTPGMSVPVLILDLNDEEADKLLVTLDPLAGLAGIDPEKLTGLLSEIKTDSAGLRELFDGLRPPVVKEGLTDPDAISHPLAHSPPPPRSRSAAQTAEPADTPLTKTRQGSAGGRERQLGSPERPRRAC